MSANIIQFRQERHIQMLLRWSFVRLELPSCKFSNAEARRTQSSAEFNPNSEAGLSVAATPRRRKVQATPSSPVAAAIMLLPEKNATGASLSPCGDEASPLLSAGRFGVRV
jgi:hypothetical protein